MRQYAKRRIDIGESGTVMYDTLTVFYQYCCREKRQCRILCAVKRKLTLYPVSAFYNKFLFIQNITLS